MGKCLIAALLVAHTIEAYADSFWGIWQPWGDCSRTCGTAVQIRSRHCHTSTAIASCPGDFYQTKSCSTPCPVNGNWATWQPWSRCDRTCGDSTRVRLRTCSNPPPESNGSDCPGSMLDKEPCSTTPCPVNGQWATWQHWSRCDKTCGDGSRIRLRTCSNPAPEHNGSDCPGSMIDKEPCSSIPCQTCTVLSRPANGHVIYEDNVTVHYVCDTDYVLIGLQTRQCDAQGHWSGDEPKCEAVPKPSSLRCRACDRVKHLDQCNRIITCLDGEECFTEHIINSATRLSVFSSGCRPKQDCPSPSSVTSGHEVVNCSECCSDLNAPFGCNSELCSFREHSDAVHTTYCLQCHMEESIDECNNISYCGPNQMCISSTTLDGTNRKVNAGCFSSNLCLSLINTIIEVNNATRDATRQITNLCDMCCGDDGCNSYTCEDLSVRMGYLYQHGQLDMLTLKAKDASSASVNPAASSIPVGKK